MAQTDKITLLQFVNLTDEVFGRYQEMDPRLRRLLTSHNELGPVTRDFLGSHGWHDAFLCARKWHPDPGAVRHEAFPADTSRCPRVSNVQRIVCGRSVEIVILNDEYGYSWRVWITLFDIPSNVMSEKDRITQFGVREWRTPVPLSRIDNYRMEPLPGRWIDVIKFDFESGFDKTQDGLHALRDRLPPEHRNQFESFYNGVLALM